MRVIRFILVFVAVLVVLAAIAALVAFSPFVQTWYVNRALSRYSAWHGSVESASVGFSAVTLTNVRFERDGVVLTVPQLDATLPVSAAFWKHPFSVSQLSAKGCTLDLTRQREAHVGGSSAAKRIDDRKGTDSGTTKSAAGGQEASGSPVASFGSLQRWVAEVGLPANTSINGIDLDGDVRMPLLPDRGPIEVHFKAKGGELAEGKMAKFALEAATAVATENAVVYQATARGELAVAIAKGAIERLQFTGDASSDDATVPRDITLTASAVTALGPHFGECTLEVGRGGRRLLGLAGSMASGTRQVEGTWNVDLREADLTRLLSALRLPPLTIAADGKFSADRASGSMRVAGHATGKVSQLDGLLGMPALLGDLTAMADFDVTQQAQALRVDVLDVSIADTEPLVTLHAAQPFAFDETKREIEPTRDGDWLHGKILRLPLSWLPTLPTAIAFTHGAVAGPFAVTAIDGGFVARSTEPFVARGVSIERAGRSVALDLDATAPLVARYSSKNGWVLETTALEIGSAGRKLATFSGTVTPRHEAYRKVSIAGTLTADLDAWSSQPIVGARSIRGRSLSAEFETNIGVAGDLVAKLTVTGHASDHSVVANFSASIDDYSAVTFRMPTTLTIGSNVAEVAVNGTWASKPEARQVDVALDSNKVAIEHLKFIGAALGFGEAELRKVFTHERAPDAVPTAARDARPWWGNWVGRVRIDFRELAFGPYALENVGGTFDFDHDAFRLRGGRGIFNPSQPTKLRRGEMIETPSEPRSVGSVEAELSFDPKADLPYALKASGTIDEIDAPRVLGTTRIGGALLLEGHLAVAATLTGSGANLADVVGRRREEIRLTSKAGILRLLKTDVASALPDAPNQVSDALATVGSAFGALFGRHGNSIASENHLPKATESVLNATYELKEFAYTDLSITATRGNDGSFALTDIVATAAREHLTGSGTIAYVAGEPLNARPLHLELQLGVKGILAERLTDAGLVSGDKDALGYAKLRQPLSFGGTLAEFDNSAWNALLVKAATPPTKPAKRGG